MQKPLNVNTVYKFLRPSDHTIENLTNGQLWFSLPKKLNDPFDCKIDSYHKGTPEQWEKWLNRKDYTEIKKAEIRKQLKSVNYNTEMLGDGILTEELQVLSLTKRNDSVLMWSHYAKAHTGVCLGFQTYFDGENIGMRFSDEDVLLRIPGVQDGFLPLFTVYYCLDMPEPFNLVTEENTKRLAEFAIRKHPDWVYEEEVRVVVTESMLKKQEVRYVREDLKEVVFGCMASEDTISKISKILREKFPNSGKDILRRKAIPVKGQYAVKIEDM